MKMRLRTDELQKGLIHHSVEGVPGVHESKGKVEKLEHTKRRDDNHFLNVVYVHWHLAITFVPI